MKRILVLIAVVFPFFAHASALDGIVPAPARAELLKGSMRVSGVSVKCDPAFDERSADAISRLSARIGLVSGRMCNFSKPVGMRQAIESGAITGIVFAKVDTLQSEAYTISVGPKVTIIRAGDFNGVFYAIQTLKQMLPAAIYGTEPAEKEKWVIPCCEIEDSPRFSYRGMHLDCSRHFWSTDEVKKYLDVMAMYKLNRFHWHLTDDQGWRIEIKAYPLLTQVGGYREGTMVGKDFDSNDGVRYGGFYTQDEVREIVEYAASLGITVIPEIDLPGHMLAAMSAYPWLGCSGGPYAAWTRWGVSDQVLCVGKETTFNFLEKVLAEVAELFPGEYIHIGGDECPKSEWEKCSLCQARIAELGLKDDAAGSAEQHLQNYVTARIQEYLSLLGKKTIGWDEILEGELVPGATVMSWRGTDRAKEAAGKGFDTILTPTSHCYFDYCQSDDTDSEPLGIGGLVTLEKVYGFDPVEGMSEAEAAHVLGVQANLWTEYIQTPEHLEYMLLPRLLALSEVQWSRPERRDFQRFVSSLGEHEFPILKISGYNFRKND